MIQNAKEIKLFDSGHTLSLIRKPWDGVYAYRGSVGFTKIDLFIGKDVKSLKKAGEITILRGKRWPVAFNHESKIHLFCTSSDGNSKDMFKYQHIHHYESYDGSVFQYNGVVVDGSAPWVYYEHDNYYFFYHRKRATHQILLKVAHDPAMMDKAEEHVLIETRGPSHALSAPAVFKTDKYYMLTEYRDSQHPKWRTDIYEAKKPQGPWKFKETILTGWRACAFPHILDDKLIVTYSHLNDNGKWDMRYREIRL